MTVAAAAPRLSRRISEYAFLTFCWVATAVAIVALAAILWSLLSQGIGGFLKPDGGGLDLDIFTKSTPAPGSVGGLMNAIGGGGVMALGQQLMSQGLGMGEITGLAKETMAVAREHAGPDVVDEVVASVPGLIQFV